MEQRVKAVIFDMNGVLVKGTELEKETPLFKGFHNMMSKSLKVNIDKWIDAIDTSYAKSIEGKISERETLNTIAKNLDVRPKNLEKTILKNYRKVFKRNKELYRYAFNLKKEGYKIAILSDQWHLSKKALLRKSDLKKFDVSIISCDVGMRKPNPKIYKLILKKLKVKPLEAVFVDNRDWNTKSAEGLEVKTILFKNNTQTFRELGKILKSSQNAK